MQNKQETWQLFAFMLMNSSKAGKLPTAGHAKGRSQVLTLRFLAWVIVSTLLLLSLNILSGCLEAVVLRPALLRPPHRLLDNPSRNLISKLQSSTPQLPRLGLGTLQMNTAGVFLCGLTFDCAVKSSLLVFTCSEHLTSGAPYVCCSASVPGKEPWEQQSTIYMWEITIKKHLLSCIFLSRGARDVALADQRGFVPREEHTMLAS